MAEKTKKGTTGKTKQAPGSTPAKADAASGRTKKAPKTTPAKAATGKNKEASRRAPAKPATQQGARVDPSRESARASKKNHARAGGTGRKEGAPARAKVITPAERVALISDTAYFMAEARGFAGGDPARDWLEAERQVDERLRSGGIAIG